MILKYNSCLDTSPIRVASTLALVRSGPLLYKINLTRLLKIIHSQTSYSYQYLINSKSLQPDWINCPHITARHVSAQNLVNTCHPTRSKALHEDNADAAIWLDSYKEEYLDLKRMNLYEEIQQEEFRKLQHKSGKPLPTMCVLTIKYKNGYPDRVKNRIFILGNQ